MNVKICKSVLNGTINICPSKSFEQRAWAMSTLPEMEIEIVGTGNSRDANTSKKIATKLMNQNRTNNIFDCGESALCARMFPPIIALHTNKFTIDGHGTILNRNIRHDLEFYEKFLGWEISHTGFPFTINNAKISSGEFHIDGSHTSQIVSGLMLALSTLSNDSRIYVHRPSSIGYIFLTANIANKVGSRIKISQTDNTLDIKISGKASFHKTKLIVEGDWSNAAFLIAAGLSNGDIEITGLNLESMQPDKSIIDALKICGAKYRWEKDKLTIHKSNIHGFEFDAYNCPDLIPPLCAIALHADSKCEIRGANRLVGKESNRLAVIVQEIKKLGANIYASNDCITIMPCDKIYSTTVSSHNDHRIAMMLSVVGLSSDGIIITDCGCIDKSYPDFFNDIKVLGGNIKVENK